MEQQPHYHKYNRKPPVQSVDSISCIKMRIPTQPKSDENAQKTSSSVPTLNLNNLNTISNTSAIKMQVAAVAISNSKKNYIVHKNSNKNNIKFQKLHNVKNIERQKVNNNKYNSKNNISTAKGRQTLPILQWPWNNSSSDVTISMAKDNIKNLITSTANATIEQQNKKRNLTISHANINNGVRTGNSDSGAKKARSNAQIATTNDNANDSVGTTNNKNSFSSNCSKRLKSAALEESQTKITGYFKAQMKAHNSNIDDKRHHHNISQINDQQLATSSTPTINTTSITANQVNSSALTTSLTGDSLNNLFNILTHFKENSGQEQEKANGDVEAKDLVHNSKYMHKPMTPVITPTAISYKNNNNNNKTSTIPVPALKKIERSKPTKIAQVAPSLRKMPTNNNIIAPQANSNNSCHTNYNNNNGSYKSPPKKHVAIAPRTPEMKQQLQQAAALKNIGTKTLSTSASQNSMPQLSPAANMTRASPIYTNNGQQQIKQIQNKSQSGNSLNAMTANSGTIPIPQATTTPTFYQLPMQLPNLVQLPQILATTNGTSIMQINNIGAASAKVTQSTSSSAAATQAAQAAQYLFNGPVFKLHQISATTAATNTAAVAAAAVAATNSFHMMNATDLQDLWLKQQQLQQSPQKIPDTSTANNGNNGTSFQEVFQHQIMAALANQQQQVQQQQLQRLGATSIQQQPVFMATPAGLLFNAASLPAMLAQAAAAIAVNTGAAQQQQRPPLNKQQPLPALQPIHSSPMATATTAATLPALSSIFAANGNQHHDVNEIQQVPQQEVIKNSCYKFLNVINDEYFQFQFQQQQLAQQLALAQHQQQQFITSTQPPPLSAVSIGNNNSLNNINMPLNSNANHLNKTTVTNNPNIPLTPVNNMTNITSAPQTVALSPKLAIIKGSPSAQYSGLNSQPPPLVTISNIKPRPISNTTTLTEDTTTHTTNTTTTISTSNIGGTMQPQPKLPTLAKTHQQRSIKKNNNNNEINNKSSTGKIIASLTTPPPLIPTVLSNKLPFGSPKPLVSWANGITMPTSSKNMNNRITTPNLVALSNLTSTSTITANAPTTAAVAKIGTPPLLPSLSPVTKNSAATENKKNGMSTAAELAPINSVDLFDFVKNSKGAISITLTNNSTHGNTKTDTTAKTTYKVTPNFLQSFSFQNDDNNAIYLNNQNVNKWKPENSDDADTEENYVNSIQISNNIDCSKSVNLSSDNHDNDNDEQIPFSLKDELNNENSLSGYSSHSVSSAADLSLEASTQGSSNSPVGVCQEENTNDLQEENTMPSQDHNMFITPTVRVGSTSDGIFSNVHNSSTTMSGVSSNDDMFSELVTSSSESMSASNLTVSSKTNSCNTVDDLESDTVDELPHLQRNITTPESGIGGSLSNCESNSSSTSGMSSTSVQCSSVSGNLSSLTTSGSTSLVRSNVPSPISGSDNCNDGTMTNSSSNDATSLSTLSSVSVRRVIANSSCLSLFNTSTYSSANFSPCSFASISTLTATTPTTIKTSFLDDSNLTANSSSQQNCAISPILSQPKTIRFPASRHGPKGAKRHHDGVCYWNQCNKKHDSNSKLLDHMQSHHVNTQNGPFACLWVGCKVYNKESCSRRWLERHVLSHGGSKQFKCIVEGCGLRFGSQLALQKHVNNHFNATENKESNNKRTSDPPVPKQLRKNGKKLRYRRQPFSARMFDFFDSGIMEGLQHRLRQISCLTSSCNTMTFYGQSSLRRTTNEGNRECFVHWTPQEIISDEWLPDSEEPYVKTIGIKSMKSAEKIRLESMLRSSYKMPYTPNLPEYVSEPHHSHNNQSNQKYECHNGWASIKTPMRKGNTNNGAVNVESDNEYNDPNSIIDDETSDIEEEEDYITETDAATSKTSNNSLETVSLMEKMLSLSAFEPVLPEHKKHSRKPQKRISI